MLPLGLVVVQAVQMVQLADLSKHSMLRMDQLRVDTDRKADRQARLRIDLAGTGHQRDETLLVHPNLSRGMVIPAVCRRHLPPWDR